MRLPSELPPAPTRMQTEGTSVGPPPRSPGSGVVRSSALRRSFAVLIVPIRVAGDGIAVVRLGRWWGPVQDAIPIGAERRGLNEGSRAPRRGDDHRESTRSQPGNPGSSQAALGPGAQ